MIISQNVPMCPKCSALMAQRHQCGQLYYFCHDCLGIYKVVGVHKAEIELIVTDTEERRMEMEVAG